MKTQPNAKSLAAEANERFSCENRQLFELFKVGLRRAEASSELIEDARLFDDGY
jgi:hypothetical protein